MNLKSELYKYISAMKKGQVIEFSVLVKPENVGPATEIIKEFIRCDLFRPFTIEFNNSYSKIRKVLYLYPKN